MLARIEADGVMRAGTRASAPPFARTLASGEFEGFSVDLLEEIRADVERRVGRNSEILYPLDRDNRTYLSTVSIWAR